jgi:hypothetical protein
MRQHLDSCVPRNNASVPCCILQLLHAWVVCNRRLYVISHQTNDCYRRPIYVGIFIRTYIGQQVRKTLYGNTGKIFVLVLLAMSQTCSGICRVTALCCVRFDSRRNVEPNKLANEDVHQT